MKILYVNAAFRDGSRTAMLAQKVLAEYANDEIIEVALDNRPVAPLDRTGLAAYNEAVRRGVFEEPMFDAAKRFAEADEIVIAAPFWNYGIPAVLHDYLELVCTQGITFDLAESGAYFSKCRAKRLTFVTTAGGFIPENDHAFSYIADLCRAFWSIPEVRCVKAEGLDIRGANVGTLLESAYLENA